MKKQPWIAFASFFLVAVVYCKPKCVTCAYVSQWVDYEETTCGNRKFREALIEEMEADAFEQGVVATCVSE